MNSYFLTYGRGMLSAVISELENFEKRHLCPIQITEREIEGKLAFRTNLSLSYLICLRTIERLFYSATFLSLKEELKNRNGQQILDIIEENFNFDFKSYVPFDHEFINLNDESKAKRLCKSYTFRVDCRMTGKWKKAAEFKSKLIANLTDRVTKSNPNLEVDVSIPDFWLTCHISDVCLAIGVAVTKQPLSFRSYIKHVGLRATICSTMIDTAECSQFDLILDPFCGKSTITAEMLFNKDKKEQFWFCSDSSWEQLEKSRDNLDRFASGYELVRANLCEHSSLPYRSGIVDVIISDLPFGKNHSIEYFMVNDDSSTGSNKLTVFYRKVLAEFDRILQKSGTIVLLVNSSEINLFKECFKDNFLGNLELISINQVSLGETNAAIVKILKDTNNK